MDPSEFSVVGPWLEAGPGSWDDDDYWTTFARRIVDYPAGIGEPWGLLGRKPNTDVLLLDLAQPLASDLWPRLKRYNLRAVRYVVPTPTENLSPTP